MASSSMASVISTWLGLGDGIWLGGRQRVNFRFTSAVLRGENWETPLLPFGQGWYCSNYYELEPSETAGICDWCLSEERSDVRHGPSSKKHAGRDSGSGHHRSGYSSGDKLKRNSDQEESATRGKGSGSSSSSKPAGRRYKLLKDVLC